MKVLCIDTTPKRELTPDQLLHLRLIKEGSVYEVEFEIYGTFKLKGINTLPQYIWLCPFPTYLKQRFVPLSEIDEMELVNEKQLVNQ